MASSTEKIATRAEDALDVEEGEATSTIATVPSFHIPCLDGIRACAFLVVFLAHAGFEGFFPGGFGVTVFFFLSGYLITTLMRREYAATGGVNFRKFYLRRLLRIAPPMYLTLLFVLIMERVGVTSRVMRLDTLVAQLLSMTNYWTIYHGYDGVMLGTGVLWSLAVEEHFYFVFPFVGLYLMSRFRPSSQAAILGATCLVILLWRCLLVFYFHSADVRTYKATDTRIDSIVFGCILALYQNPVLDAVRIRRSATKWLILFASGCLLAASFLVRSEAFRESFRYSIQGVALFGLFYVALSNSRWPLFSWLDYPVLRAIGILSYSLYLIHFWAIIVVARHLPNSGLLKLVAVSGLVCLAYAALMYYAVERPCARLRKRLHA